MKRPLLRTLTLTLAVLLALSGIVVAADRAVFTRAAVLYIAPDATSEKLITVDRGREAVILEKSNAWAHVIVTLPPATQQVEPYAEPQQRNVSGWMLDKGLITAATPNGDQIMYGEAVDSENEASRSHGRKGAAEDARRLYYRTSEYFPQSPLAGEALYRAADIQWQLDKADLDSRPSARNRDPRDRQPINDESMKMVEKKFPRTKWADLAAFRMLDNKLCGNWAAQSKCPEKEAQLYEKYAEEHPQSPAAVEALYNAAYRFAALIELYKSEGQAKKSPEAAERSIAQAQKVLAKNASPDWNARAQRLIYMVRNNIAVYGSTVD